jgi:hypothetical protein
MLCSATKAVHTRQAIMTRDELGSYGTSRNAQLWRVGELRNFGSMTQEELRRYDTR